MFYSNKARAKRIARSKMTDNKKKRVLNKNEVLKLDEAQARKERAKRDGTYKSGMNMDEGGEDGYIAADLDALLQEAAT
jgi:phosphopantothenate synthetase